MFEEVVGVPSSRAVVDVAESSPAVMLSRRAFVCCIVIRPFIFDTSCVSRCRAILPVQRRFAGSLKSDTFDPSCSRSYSQGLPCSNGVSSHVFHCSMQIISHANDILSRKLKCMFHQFHTLILGPCNYFLIKNLATANS